MAFEWVLNTPKQKDFCGTSVRFHETEDVKDGLVQTVRQEIRERVTLTRAASIVRLVSATNLHAQCLFTVRFIFGNINATGAFEPAERDDGIVIGGPEYVELNLDPDGSIDEPDLLKMCARIMEWDGEMRELGGGPTNASTPTESLL